MDGIVACLGPCDYEEAPVNRCLLFVEPVDLLVEVGGVCFRGFTRIGQGAFGITQLATGQFPELLIARAFELYLLPEKRLLLLDSFEQGVEVLKVCVGLQLIVQVVFHPHISPFIGRLR